MDKRGLVGLTILLIAIIAACEPDDTIEYQSGYPNVLAGNWYTYDYQGKYTTFDSIHQISVEKPENVEGSYELVTALDPSDNNWLVIDNIWNGGLRVKALIDSNRLSVKYGEQLDLFSDNEYGVAYISVDGFVVSEQSDQIILFVGLYDRYYQFIDSLLTYGTRKTGWEGYEPGN